MTANPTATESPMYGPTRIDLEAGLEIFEDAAGTVCLTVGPDDRVTIDAEDADLATLADLVRRAQVWTDGHAHAPRDVARWVEREARRVAEENGRERVRAHLNLAWMAGRDDLDVDVWHRAHELLRLVDVVETRDTLTSFAQFPDMLDTLAAVAAGALTWRTQLTDTGPESTLMHVGEETADGPAEDQTVATLADLRADGLVERYVMDVTSAGWAVLALARREGIER